MSRLKVAGLAIAAAMILAANQGAIAGKPDGEQKTSKANTSATKKGQTKAGRSPKKSSKSHKSTLGESSKILQELLEQQEACEDRQKVRRALNSLISGSDCGTSYGYGRDDYRSGGKIDFGKLVNLEMKRQEEIEERQKIARALKSFLNNDCDSCAPKCETSSIESYSTPYRSSVVLESPVRYYRYVNCD